jgi:hypothetical protein
MAKTHDIGASLFYQYYKFYPARWGWKVIVRGWTQEIEPPYRTSAPFIIRLPFKKAIVVGKWNGTLEEEQALSRAIGERTLSNDDFSEEKGWVPAPNETPEEDFELTEYRTYHLG